MKKHISVSVCDYDRMKLCDLCDSTTNAPGQAGNVVYTKEINGWKTLSFDMPRIADGEKNFRWDYIKNECLIRYVEDDLTEWF